MKKLIISILVGTFISGCSNIPTVKYCDYVIFERVGNIAGAAVQGCKIPRDSGDTLNIINNNLLNF